ncbi:MAG TPA: hypothetical protein VNF46_00480 [Gammaproteobacteria bacterium]|nr:hypothetical protein [Gammaproteobacteria bacterium]
MQDIVKQISGMLGAGEREAGIIATNANNTVAEIDGNHWRQQRDMANVLRQRDAAVHSQGNSPLTRMRG